MAEWLIAGAGIGGLAAALALQRAGLSSQVWEQARTFGEVGAGIQMGPNVTRILQRWGLGPALQQVAVQPQALVSADAVTGHELGRLDLQDAGARYGAPYMTVHRADLHAVLLAALDPGLVSTRLGCPLADVRVLPDGALQVGDEQGGVIQAAALIGADGLWSRVRELWGADGVPMPTGHWAYRALLPTRLLSPRWREPVVRVWMAPGLHAVHYPVRRGEWLNVVVLVEGRLHAAQRGWDVPLDPAQIRDDVQSALRGLCPDLHDVLRPVEAWRAWSLWSRPPMGPQCAGAAACPTQWRHFPRPGPHGLGPQHGPEAGRAAADGSALVVRLDPRFFHFRHLNPHQLPPASQDKIAPLTRGMGDIGRNRKACNAAKDAFFPEAWEVAPYALQLLIELV
jgi:salicylate hydroxylase